MADQQTTQSEKTNDAVLASAPAEWPGAFGIYKYSKQAVLLNFSTLFFIWLASIVISVIVQPKHGILGQIIELAAGTVVTAAMTLTFIASVRKKRLSLQEAVKTSLPFFVNVLVYTVLTCLIAVVSLVLLVVPFFIVMPRLVLTSYFLLDKNMNAVDALKASWAATEGHAGKVWGIFGANVAMFLLVFTIIGIPFAIYFLILYSAAIAVLYEHLHKHVPAASKA